MKVLIIEDEKAAAQRLSNQIAQLRVDWDIAACIDTIESATKWLSENPLPDIIFLDIQLSDGLSFQIFDQIKIRVPVIFTTAYDSYAIKAFELNSVDYLLKPISIDQLSKALNKYETLRQDFSDHVFEDQLIKLFGTLRNDRRGPYRIRFLIPQHDGYIPVATDNIAYFYADDNSIVVTTNQHEKYTFYYSLDKLEKELDPRIFYRVNRAFIVSANSIKKAHNYYNYKIMLDLEPKPEKDVIISRQKVSEFKTWFNL